MHFVGLREDVRENPGAQSVPLIFLEQVELSEARMIRVDQPGHRAHTDGFLRNREERLLGHARQVDPALVGFIPRPTRTDMWP